MGNDKEIRQRFMHWQQVAQGTVQSAMQHSPELMEKMMAGKENHVQQMQANVKRQIAQTIEELSKGNNSIAKEAKKQIQALSAAEKQEFVDGMQKKMQVFQNLPNEGKMRYMTGLKKEEKLDFVKALLVLSSMVDQPQKDGAQE